MKVRGTFVGKKMEKGKGIKMIIRRNMFRVNHIYI